MNCAICRKPMGFEASKKGKNACKKHKHILLSHLNEEKTGEVRSVSFLGVDGVETPVRNLEDYERGVMNDLFILFRN